MPSAARPATQAGSRTAWRAARRRAPRAAAACPALPAHPACRPRCRRNPPARTTTGRRAAEVRGLTLKTARLKINAVITMLIQNAPKVSQRRENGKGCDQQNAARHFRRSFPARARAGRTSASSPAARTRSSSSRRSRYRRRRMTLTIPMSRAPEDRAVHVAETAQDHRGKRIEHLGRPISGKSCSPARKRAGGGRHHRAHDDARPRHPIDVDAACRGDFGSSDDRPELPAESTIVRRATTGRGG